MTANERQVGGDHYQKNEYQHWDWVCDIELPYLLGCATKYVTRWRDKNGVQDLEKAIHYVDKAAERQVDHWVVGPEVALNERFLAQLPEAEKVIVDYMIHNQYEYAVAAIRELIKADAAVVQGSPMPESLG